MSKATSFDRAASPHPGPTRNHRGAGTGEDVFVAPAVAGSCGQILLDAALNVVAVDEQARNFGALECLLTSAALVHARERALDGEPAIQFSLPMPASADAPIAIGETIHVRLNRLDGVDGLLLLVTLSRADTTASHVDPLTSVSDRRAIGDRLEVWRRAANAEAVRFAVLFLDLDDFKAVNDSHGHAVGDAVLQALAARWQECVRDGDLVARYGGDEFVVLLRGAATDAEVQPVIRRLEDETARPVAVGELTLTVTATIGWATVEGSDWTADALVAAADRDMYARKRQPSR